MRPVEILKTHFPDIIRITEFSIPNYEVIEFKIFLERQFEKKIDFINAEIVASLRAGLISKYYSEKDCFRELGILRDISINDLNFYQEEVGIEGPKFHNINDPVLILKYNNKYILWEGYHRILVKIIEGMDTVNCHLLVY